MSDKLNFFIWRKATIILVIFMMQILMGTVMARNINNNLRKTAAVPDREMKVHNIGTLWTATSNYGVYGDPAVPDGQPSMEWPGGSNTHYLWEGRFWCGAIVDGSPWVSHADFGNYEYDPTDPDEIYYWPGFNMGPGKSIMDSYVVFDDLTSSTDHNQLGVMIKQTGLTWSTPLYDDFIAYEIEIVKLEGHGPEVLDDFMVSWVYDADIGVGTDGSSPHIDDAVDYDGWDGTDGDTDLEDIVHNWDWNKDAYFAGYSTLGIPFGWPTSGSPVIPHQDYDPTAIAPDGFYDEYQVMLHSGGPYVKWQSNAFGTAGDYAIISKVEGPTGLISADIYTDFVAGDTLRGYVFSRNMSYMYDGDHSATPNDDTQEGGVVSGFMGGRIVYTPYFDMYGAYNATEDDIYMRPSSHQWWNWESDPGSDVDKYAYMTASHRASTVQGQRYDFLPHPFKIGAPTFDYRFMISTGPFDDFGGSYNSLKFVWVAGVGNGMQGIRENSDYAVLAYYQGAAHSDPYNPSDYDEDNHWVIPVPPTVPQLVYSTDNESFSLRWDEIAETAIDPLLSEVDFEGYRVYRAGFSPSADKWELIYAFDNIDGEVAVTSDFATGDVLLDEAGNPIMVDLPDLAHSFTDDGKDTPWGTSVSAPINGLPYYYAVTAYDPDKPADPVSGRAALQSIESAKINYLKDPSGKGIELSPQGWWEEGEEADITKVSVFPNPYRGSSILEGTYQDKIAFTNLPAVCEIMIFTIVGDHVITLDHTAGSTMEIWDMVSRNHQDVTNGLYFYVVRTESEQHTGKFVIVRGQ